MTVAKNILDQISYYLMYHIFPLIANFKKATNYTYTQTNSYFPDISTFFSFTKFTKLVHISNIPNISRKQNFIVKISNGATNWDASNPFVRGFHKVFARSATVGYTTNSSATQLFEEEGDTTEAWGMPVEAGKRGTSNVCAHMHQRYPREFDSRHACWLTDIAKSLHVTY